jgi:hypothetical protein
MIPGKPGRETLLYRERSEISASPWVGTLAS